MNILRFDETASEEALRLAIVECGRILYERGLTTANDGNISIRLDARRVLLTPSGVCKGRMTPEDLLIVDLDGKILEPAADSSLAASSETPMHLEVYRIRADVRAVLHAHPVFATALTVAGMNLPDDVLPEVALTMNSVPTTAYARPSSDENAVVIRDLIRDHDALLLRQHGSLTVGRNLDEALIHLERIEHVAQVFWRAKLLGHVERIPPDEMAKLRQG
jgi:L-fuculose-phosphate aldolase